MTNRTWTNYSQNATKRAQLIAAILGKHRHIEAANILDIGCGEGITAVTLSQMGAAVAAIDIAKKFDNRTTNVNFYQMASEQLNFADNSFDIVIMQDVIEHTQNPRRALQQVARVLKQRGILFISTPNRLSPFNFIADPHWGLPGVAVLPRKGVIFVVNTLFRKDRRDRSDWAALHSLRILKNLITENKFSIQFENRFVAQKLVSDPESVVCRPLHLKVVNILKQLRTTRWFPILVNDRMGFFNYLLNPTWYIIAEKK